MEVMEVEAVMELVEVVAEHRQLEDTLKEDRRFERVKIQSIQREQREL